MVLQSIHPDLTDGARKQALVRSREWEVRAVGLWRKIFVMGLRYFLSKEGSKACAA